MRAGLGAAPSAGRSKMHAPEGFRNPAARERLRTPSGADCLSEACMRRNRGCDLTTSCPHWQALSIGAFGRPEERRQSRRTFACTHHPSPSRPPVLSEPRRKVRWTEQHVLCCQRTGTRVLCVRSSIAPRAQLAGSVSVRRSRGKGAHAQMLACCFVCAHRGRSWTLRICAYGKDTRLV